MKQQKTWADYLWIIELLYLTLGLFNILFAWLGLIFFITPLLIPSSEAARYTATAFAEEVNYWGC